MNQNPVDYIKAFEGRDKNGESKAVVVLQNQTYTMAIDGTATPKIHDQAATVYAILKFAINNGLLAITLTFEDFEDEDYLKFKSLCSNMTLDTNANDGFASDDLEHHLVLTISDRIDHDYFMTCFLQLYAFDGMSPSATFICKLDDAIMYQIPDNVKNQIIDSLDMEDDNDNSNDDLALI